ncbi:MAG: UDP binding domain-containing protein, partial [Chloroflexota bacterium]
RLCPDACAAAGGAHALLVVTDWNEFKQLDMEQIKALMATPNLVDGRNVYDGATLRRMGFSYWGTGRN